jgi:protein associated with RNAse G/E
MDELKKGTRLKIQCYKHNRRIHRAWDEATFLEEKDNYLVFGNENTLVIDTFGNFWKTKEPAIIYFFKDKWFNIIAQLKKDGIYYYCNIASPIIIEDNTIKYIDYDLDLRIFPSREFKVLDEKEYKYHQKKMRYPENLKEAIKNGLDELIEMYQAKGMFFNDEINLHYHNIYKEIKKSSKK